MTVEAICTKCNLTAHYHPPITLDTIVNNPPFHNMPRLEGECDHSWNIGEINS